MRHDIEKGQFDENFMTAALKVFRDQHLLGILQPKESSAVVAVVAGNAWKPWTLHCNSACAEVLGLLYQDGGTAGCYGAGPTLDCLPATKSPRTPTSRVYLPTTSASRTSGRDQFQEKHSFSCKPDFKKADRISFNKADRINFKKALAAGAPAAHHS